MAVSFVAVVAGVVAPVFLGIALDIVLKQFGGYRLSTIGGASSVGDASPLWSWGFGVVDSLSKIVGSRSGVVEFYSDLVAALCIALFMFLLSAAFEWVSNLLMNDLAASLLGDLRKRASRKLFGLSPSRIDELQPGDSLSLFVNDLDHLSKVIAESVPQLVKSLFITFTLLLVMLLLSWILALIVLVLAIFAGLYSRFVIQRSQKWFAMNWSAVASCSSVVQDSVAEHEVVRVHGLEPLLERRYSTLTFRQYNSAFRGRLWSESTPVVVQFLNSLSFVCVVGLGLFLISLNMISVGIVQTFVQYSRQFSQPMLYLAGMSSDLQSALACSDRVRRFLSNSSTVLVDSCSVQSHGGLAVELDRVEFCYDSGSSFCVDVSMRLERGRTYGLVGDTGSGKSTLGKLLAGFYSPSRGAVVIGGSNIAQPRMHSASGRILYLPQDYWLALGSLRDNVSYGCPGSTFSSVASAIDACGLQRLSDSLPCGMDSTLSDDDQRISNGQRQLIAVSRVSLVKPGLLILDESTSRLDAATEADVLGVINRQHPKATKVIIAHRLSSLKSVDKIFVLSEGSVIESGSHESLLARGGHYSELFAAGTID